MNARVLPAIFVVSVLAIACGGSSPTASCSAGTAIVALTNASGATLHVRVKSSSTDDDVSIPDGASQRVVVSVGHVVVDAYADEEEKTLYLADELDVDCGTSYPERLGAADDAIFTITMAGAGVGKVTSSPAGVDCSRSNPSGCTAHFPAGKTVKLFALPDAGSYVQSFAPCPSSIGPPTPIACTIPSVAGAETLTVDFETDTPTLGVSLTNTAGTVTSDPAGIECGDMTSNCYASFPPGSTVTLTAAPLAGGSFPGFRHPSCTPGALTCAITIGTTLQVVGADFVPPNEPVEVVFSGTGSGEVNFQIIQPSVGPATQCATTCTGSAPFGAVLLISGGPSLGSTFAGFTGSSECAPFATSCEIAVTSALSIGAKFDLQ